METLECIKTRRSVRKFKTDSVSKETIEKLVLAASYAPSWKNTQTTRYIAITNEEVKARLATECCAEHNAQIINGAPLLIATLIVDKRSEMEAFLHLERMHGRHLTMVLQHRLFALRQMTLD